MTTTRALLVPVVLAALVLVALFWVNPTNPPRSLLTQAPDARHRRLQGPENAIMTTDPGVAQRDGKHTLLNARRRLFQGPENAIMTTDPGVAERDGKHTLLSGLGRGSLEKQCRGGLEEKTECENAVNMIFGYYYIHPKEVCSLACAKGTRECCPDQGNCYVCPNARTTCPNGKRGTEVHCTYKVKLQKA